MLFLFALAGFTFEGAEGWREPVSMALGLAITALELFAFNLVLNLRSYRPRDYQRAVPAFLIAVSLWWFLSPNVLATDISVPPFLSVHFLLLSLFVVILAGFAAVAVFVAIVQAVGRALNPNVATPRAEISWIGLAKRILAAGVLAVIALFATAAVAGFVPRSGGFTEAVAIGSLRAVNSAQASYAATCAGGGYAINLADLFKPRPGELQGFISPDLSANGVVKSGYVITLAKDAAAGVKNIGTPAATCNGSMSQPVSSYFASATPAEPGRTGRRYFATDSRGTIYFSTTRPIANPIVEGEDVSVLQ